MAAVLWHYRVPDLNHTACVRSAVKIDATDKLPFSAS